MPDIPVIEKKPGRGDKLKAAREAAKDAALKANAALGRAFIAGGSALQRQIDKAVHAAEPKTRPPGFRVRQIFAFLGIVFFVPVIFVAVPVFHDVLTSLTSGFGNSTTETLVGALVPFVMLGILAGCVYGIYWFVRMGGPGVFDRKN